MAEAILYCSSCNRLILPSDIDSGAAISTAGGALCAGCVSKLDPERRKALRAASARARAAAESAAPRVGARSSGSGIRRITPRRGTARPRTPTGHARAITDAPGVSPLALGAVGGLAVAVVITTIILLLAGGDERTDVTAGVPAAPPPLAAPTVPGGAPVSPRPERGGISPVTGRLTVSAPEDDVEGDSYAAQVALLRARSYASERPLDVSGIADRFEKVVASFPGTNTAKLASSEVAKYQSAGDVPPGAVAYNGHRYLLQSGRYFWHEARELCRRAGGHLITIADAGEDELARSITRTAGVNPWIGLTDEASEGTFVWVTGEALAYTNWEETQPDDAENFGGEDYVQLRAAGGLAWNDANDTNLSDPTRCGFICEWEPGWSPPPRARAPRDAAAFGGHRYRLFTTVKTWTEAYAACARLGGHLVSVTTDAEGAFVTDMARRAPNEVTWVGLTDEGSEGAFRWITGEPVTYTQWSDNQPDNNGGGENYVSIFRDFGYRWNDASNGWKSSYVCEWDTDATE